MIMSSSSIEQFAAQQQQSEDLLSLSYYHPNLYNMDEVRSVMVQYLMQDGCFLLRNSITRPGVLTVTVMHTNSIKHFNVGCTNTSYYLQDKHFPTISALVSFYRTHDVPNVEGVEHVRLIRPIPYVNESQHRNQGINRSASEVGHQTPSVRPLSRQPRSVDAGLANHQLVEIPTDIGTGSSTTWPRLQTATIPDPNMPQLPEAPPRKKHNTLAKLFKRDKKSSGESDGGSGGIRPQMSIEDRPPMPIPVDPRQRKIVEKVYQHYDLVRDTNADQTPDLIYHLRKTEQAGEVCECGLSLAESELPMEWSMHISREPPTEGRLFFMGANDQTVWELPFEVTLQLTQEQQDRIKRVRNDYVLKQDRLRNSGASGSGSGSSGNRSSAPVMGLSNGQAGSSGAGVAGQQRRGQSMMQAQSGPVSLNSRQPQQHECHATDDEVFH